MDARHRADDEHLACRAAHHETLLLAALTLVFASVVATSTEAQQVLERVRLVAHTVERDAAVCTALEPGDSVTRCIELDRRLRSAALLAEVSACVDRERYARPVIDGGFSVVLEVDTSGAIARADVLASPRLASTDFMHCVEAALRRLPFHRDLSARAEQRWRVRPERRAGHADAASPWHILGDLDVGAGVILWPTETRLGFLLGLRAALLHDWIGLSASLDVTDAFDDRPGAAVLWSARLIARPEHRVSADLTIFGSIEAGFALSAGQGERVPQHEDEPAFSGLLSIGAGYWNWTFALEVLDAISESTHRVGVMVAIGGDFHVS